MFLHWVKFEGQLIRRDHTLAQNESTSRLEEFVPWVEILLTSISKVSIHSIMISVRLNLTRYVHWVKSKLQLNVNLKIRWVTNDRTSELKKQLLWISMIQPLSL